MASTVSTNRLTGMASGMDTDSMVTNLMKVEQLKIDKVKREKTYVEWEQEAYRTQVSALKEFQDKYFNVLNTEYNITTASGFKEFTTSVTIAGEKSAKVTVKGTEDLAQKEHVINSIDQLATKDTWNANSSVNGTIVSSGIYNINSLNSAFAGENNTFKLSIDGVYKTITMEEITDLNGDTNIDINDFAQQLNSKISDAFGSEYSNIVSVTNVSGSDEIQFSKDGSTIGIVGLDNTALTALGISSGSKTGVNLTQSLESVFGTISEDLTKFEINGKTIDGITSSMTVQKFMDTVNASSANVEISYNSLTKEFALKSKKEGTVNNIDLSETNTVDFFSNHLHIANDANREEGVNAQLTLDGVAITKSSNTFTVDGVSYTLKDTLTSGEKIDISIEPDVDTIFKKIKEFVADYNALVTNIQSKITEEKDYDYIPLTDDEKDDMTEDEIKLWESKAKEGILRSDTILGPMLDTMRVALYSSVQDVGLSLSDIGIQTSKTPTDGNKLTVDDVTLKAAIKDNYKDVVALFTNDSDRLYLEDADSTYEVAKATRDERYKESGLAERLNDIVNDNIRLTHGKGALVKRAGMEGVVDKESVLYKKLYDYAKEIDDLLDKFSEKETTYYNQFARMETALSTMNSQANWLQSQLSAM